MWYRTAVIALSAQLGTIARHGHAGMSKPRPALPLFTYPHLVGSGGPPPPLVDIGCNLADSAFEGCVFFTKNPWEEVADRALRGTCLPPHPSFLRDLPEVIARAKSAGVSQLIITGTSIRQSRHAAALAASEPGLFHTCGVHPHDAKSCDENTLAELTEIAAGPRWAVGASRCPTSPPLALLGNGGLWGSVPLTTSEGAMNASL